MATSRRSAVRWNESKQRWMAWVRYPDGSRRKVERVSKADAQADLNALLDERAGQGEPSPRRERLLSFNEAIDDLARSWLPLFLGAAFGAATPPDDVAVLHALSAR